MHKSLVLLAGLATLGSAAHAQSNYALDNAFGNAGIFKGAATNSAGFFTLQSAAQPDGRILVAGATYDPNVGAFDSACVLRLKSNGTADSTFGTYGYARVPFVHSTGVANCARPMPDGKVAVCGYTFAPITGGTRFYAELAMLDATGHPDAAFNSGAGLVIGGSATQDAFSLDMKVQSTGGIIVSAILGNPPTTASSSKIFRYTAAGTLDAGFGTAGSITLSPGYTDQVLLDAADRIICDWSDGSILSGAITKAIYRFSANGTPDATWGNAGKSDTIMIDNTSNFPYSMSITPLAGGKFILSNLGAAGSSVPPVQPYTTHRFTAAGHRDITYGTGGMAIDSIARFDRGSDFFTVANGDKVITMFDLPSTTQPAQRDFVLMQTDTAGAPDATFGTGGLLRTPAGNGEPLALNKMPNGSLIGTTDLSGFTGEVMRFRQTPAGIAFINNKMAAGIYPNPATTFLTLRCESGVLYAVYDMAGREVLRGKTTGRCCGRLPKAPAK